MPTEHATEHFPFAKGARPPKNAPALPLRAILRPELGVEALPTIPEAQDNLALLRGGWNMLGNDAEGDCVAVTWANVRRLVTAVLGGREVYPDLSRVLEVYKTQNPDFDPNGDPNVNGPGSNADGGMDIQTTLEWLTKNGGPDGVKPVAFAKVDHTNPAEVKAAIAVFGYVWTAVEVRANNEREFANGQPWDYDPNSTDEGGHSIITGGFTGKTTGGDEEFITWATETSFTDAFWANQVIEAWVVIWPEHMAQKSFLANVDLSALASAFHSLTGRTLVIPPQPSPAPVPDPSETPDTVLARAAKEFLQHHHTGSPLAMAKALRTWLSARGL